MNLAAPGQKSERRVCLVRIVNESSEYNRLAGSRNALVVDDDVFKKKLGMEIYRWEQFPPRNRKDGPGTSRATQNPISGNI